MYLQNDTVDGYFLVKWMRHWLAQSSLKRKQDYYQGLALKTKINIERSAIHYSFNVDSNSFGNTCRPVFFKKIDAGLSQSLLCTKGL